MADEVVNIILEPGAAYLQLFDFLVRGKVDFLFDAIYGVIQQVVLVEHFSKMIVAALKAFNHVTMFWEFSIDRMMKIHRFVRLDSLWFNVFEGYTSAFWYV
jgi:hypothetical protein